MKERLEAKSEVGGCWSAPEGRNCDVFRSLSRLATSLLEIRGSRTFEIEPAALSAIRIATISHILQFFPSIAPIGNMGAENGAPAMAKVSDVIATYRPTRVRAPSRAHAAFPNPQPLTQPSSSKLPTCTTHRSTSIPQVNCSSSHVPTTLCTSTTQRQAPMQRSSSRKSTALH